MSSLRLRLSVREKFPSVRTVQAIRWKKIVTLSNGSLLFQTTFTRAVYDEPVKNVSLNDLRNSYNSQQIFRTSYVSTFKRSW